jgi:uncharacterized integral membrane protein
VIYSLPLIVIAVVIAVMGDQADRILRPVGAWLFAHWPLIVGPLTAVFGAVVLALGAAHLASG